MNTGSAPGAFRYLPARLRFLSSGISSTYRKSALGKLTETTVIAMIISLSAMGQCLIVINDPKVAIDLLEKRSSIYSSRPKSTMVDLSGWSWNLGFIPYSQTWRSQRRTFWQQFHPGVVSRYHPLLEDSAHRLLYRLLSSPRNLVDNIRSSLGKTLINTAYGLRPSESKDRYITTFEEAMTGLDLLLTGTNILEFFPFLANIPTWLPWTTVQRRLAHYRKLTTAIRDVPWEDSKRAMTAGGSSASMASVLFEELLNTQGDDARRKEDTIKSVLAVTYAGGIDTSIASLCAFYLAMSLYPEVQRKGQAELNAIVGSSRLPTFADRKRLPYVNAIVKEVMRWHTAAPLGVPHVNIADDVYEGYFIPKDSIILPNAWAMSHDEATYFQPEEFIPERFLTEDGEPNTKVRDPASIIFGFGRRVCPGRHFAEATLFISVASALHTLDISPPVDDNGLPIRIRLKASNDLISYVLAHIAYRPRAHVNDPQARRRLQVHHPTPLCCRRGSDPRRRSLSYSYTFELCGKGGRSIAEGMTGDTWSIM
ncbi:cytochrome P450 [Daedaleopsis nitida]|nr:cytochrome P450 [Daedaleopsis nitida]